jgi:hypothetical protein
MWSVDALQRSRHTHGFHLWAWVVMPSYTIYRMEDFMRCGQSVPGRSPAVAALRLAQGGL